MDDDKDYVDVAVSEEESKTVDPVAGKTVAEILGEIVWLMTQDEAGKEMKISEIERIVMPAILEKRFHIKYANIPTKNKVKSNIQPYWVGFFDEPLGKGKKIAEFSTAKAVTQKKGHQFGRDR